VGVFGMLLFIASIFLNIYLIMALAMTTEVGGTSQTVLRGGNDNEVVAVYRLSGIIEDRAVENFRQFTRDTLHDQNVKAIVLRVDSPGGAASSADEIHAMIRDLQTHGGKKVVVSMGGVAASGGYYISAPADEIFAEETTVTGSIGVIAEWLIIKGTLDKIGMEAMVIKSTDAENWKDAISPFHKPDDRQRVAILAMLDTIQKRFEQVVREGRGERLKTNKITYTVKVGSGDEAQDVERTDIQPLNGEIFMPAQALKLGLIDAIGYEDAAIDRAAELAGLAKPRVELYKVRRGFWATLMEEHGPTGVKLDSQLLDNLQSPRVLLMWKAN
jgi:protease-4